MNSKSSFIKDLLEKKSFEYVPINDDDLDKIYDCYSNGITTDDVNGFVANYYGIYYQINGKCDIAIKWFKKAVGLNNPYAFNNLGICYYNGNGIERDYKKAFEYYKKSANLNDLYGITNLGNCYYDGNGVEQDYKKAIEYYKNAADLNNSNSIINLGDCYFNGYGIEKDYSEAIKLYKRAYELGNNDALQKLKTMFNCNHVITFLLQIIIENDELKKINEYLKIYPGSDYKEAMDEFNLLSKNPY